MDMLYHLGASHNRAFISWDAVVRGVIATCEQSIESNPPTNTTRCDATLKCILSSVDAHTAARWSAGASILAFITTIAALMSNSVDDIVLIAEEDNFMAVLLGLCSSTVFASRFGSDARSAQTVDSLFEDLQPKITEACTPTVPAATARSWWPQLALWSLYFLLCAFCAAVWYPVSVIMTQGVVVYSCPWRAHVPVWVGLTQLAVIANILLKRVTFVHEKIDLHSTPHQQSPGNTGGDAKRSCGPRPRYVILRHPQAGTLATCVRGFTSILTFALYAFATAVLGGMTMFTASEAVWCLVLFAAAAGIARIVAKCTLDDFAGCRRTIVVDVHARHMAPLKDRIDSTIQTIQHSTV